MITVFDHLTHPIWNKAYNTLHVANNRTNGGFTYSQDIVKYHLPIIEEVLEGTCYERIVISTVGEIQPKIIPINTDLIICYLHEFLEREIPRVNAILSWYKGEIIFITSRSNLYNTLCELNIKAVLLPMSIETSSFSKMETNEKYADKRVIYFGNRYLGKGKSFEAVKQAFTAKGWIFDSICFNRFNETQLLTRDQIFDKIAKYKYGIGEGRCFLEMNAMGIKTLICAGHNQGIITNEEEFLQQQAQNFSDGKVWTFSPDIDICIDNFDKAIIKSVDVQEVLPILEKQLKGVLP